MIKYLYSIEKFRWIYSSNDGWYLHVLRWWCNKFDMMERQKKKVKRWEFDWEYRFFIGDLNKTKKSDKKQKLKSTDDTKQPGE